MLRFYLTSSWRNLKKNRIFSIINIAGLAIGLASAVLAILYSKHELTYESCHANADRVYQIYTYGHFGSLEKIPYTFSPISTTLQSDYPEIETTSRLRAIPGIVFKENTPIKEDEIAVADTSMFSIFSFHFEEGTQPSGPNSIAISEKMARKYFNKNDAVGKSLTIKLYDQKREFKVSGVFADLPSNTHLKTQFIIPFELSPQLGWKTSEYGGTNYTVYAMTYPNTDYKKLNNKITQFKIPVPLENVNLGLVPIKHLHLYENISENSLGNLWLILIGGIVAMLVACFNYINLNTILFSTRTREVGVKKTFGAGKMAIFNQFITDTFVTAVLGFALAVLLIQAILPSFNGLFSTEITLKPDLETGGMIALVFVFTVLLSGFYPALVLSQSKPLWLIRTSQGAAKGKNRLMNTLITVQFLVAIMLLQFLLISQKQGRYMGDQRNIGFNGNNVICMNGREWGDLNTVKGELLRDPSIVSVSWGNQIPRVGLNMIVDWKGKDNQEMALRFFYEDDYLKVFDIKMEKGQFFSHDQESLGKDGVVINPITVHSLGLTNENPIGQHMLLNEKQYNIIGVVDNYQAVPPIFDDMPLIINRAGNQEEYLVIHVNPDKRAEAHLQINKVLSKINPEYPVDIQYYNDYTAELAKTYYATGTMTNVFTIIIIVNAMMGLFGLSLFVAERRNKEVGIRKVCGATIPQILWGLAKGFIFKLLLAFCIACPVLLLAAKGYLSVFPRHITLGPAIFFMGGVLALTMLLVASGWKLFAAANGNPVKALRYE